MFGMIHSLFLFFFGIWDDRCYYNELEEKTNVLILIYNGIKNSVETASLSPNSQLRSTSKMTNIGREEHL
jgi:hypothetical protein